MTRRQIRIALVIEGGVSLAVWMSGVANEVDALRRGGAPDRPDGVDSHALRWRELCDAMDVDVIVDVIAGTSAGGLNGALLACSIASGQPLPDLKELWVSAGQVQRGVLLREEDSTALASLLDGDYFQKRLSEVFTQALTTTTAGAADSPAAMAGQPVTLLTTATALGTQETRWVDAFGRGFHVDDHRRVFRFQNDPSRLAYAAASDGALPDDVFELFTAGDPADLSQANVAVVARAARASAGFPLAFEPVEEREPGIDLARHALGGIRTPSRLMDGGILDNAPFAPLVAEISGREVQGDWTRVIGYVVANDGLASSEGSGSSGAGGALPWIPVLASSLRLPAETSFRQGIEALSRLSMTGSGQGTGPRALLALLLDGLGPDPAAVQTLFAPYRRYRLTEELVNAERVIDAAMATGSVSSHGLPEAMPDAAPRWVPGGDFPEALAATSWTWGASVAERSLSLLIRHQRSLYGAEGSATVPEIDACLAHLSRTLSAVRAVSRRLDEVLDDMARANIPTLEGVSAAYGELSLTTVLHRLVQQAITRFAEVNGTVGGAAMVLRALLTVEVVSHCAAGQVGQTDSPTITTARMGPDVACPVLGAVPGSSELGEWKLFGTRLHHFGAFGRPDWRATDFMWGRLDATAHLVRLLTRIASPGLSDIDADAAWTVPLQESVLAEEEMSVGEVRAALAGLRQMDDSAALSQIRSAPGGVQTLEDAATDLLRMFKPPPGEPTAVGSASRYVYTSFATQPRPSPQWFTPWAARKVAGLTPLRRRLWSWVRTGGGQ